MKFNVVWLTGILVSLSLISCNCQESGYPCPNACSGKGICFVNHCSCFAGYTGGDCSLKECPKGPAWVDVPQGVDDAHNLVECSNRGTCDRESGRCICDNAYTGKSCSMNKCPNNCWGRGRCKSMRELAMSKDPGLGTIHTYKDIWDADLRFGCVCDQGYTGFDCSLRECQYGDDPMTTGQVDETQLFLCTSEGGFFTLTFKGFTSEPIPYDAVLDDVKAAIEAIHGVGQVTVTFSQPFLAVCLGTTSNQVVSVTFHDHFGDIPSLVVHSTHIGSCSDPSVNEYDACGGAPIQIAVDGENLIPTGGSPIESVAGTKENEYCSRRGRCDKTSGVCSCYDNFATSNGQGDSGDRGDCGHMSAFEITACPGLVSCSGHGTCASVSTFSCTCSIGWTGGDCSERTCAKGKSWFDLPIEDNRAHQLAECSNMGLCDTTTGECRCHSGYHGAACDKLSCPGTPVQCNGHGTCLSLSQLAPYNKVNGDSVPVTYGLIPNNPYTYDYDMIHGCLCDAGWEGYSCTLQSCPTGDDPDTGFEQSDLQVFETQLIKCVADSGAFVINFRNEATLPIAYNAEAADLKAALTSLNTITDVEVDYSFGTSVCRDDGLNVVSVTFTQELGSLPPMIAYATINGGTLEHSSGSLSLTVVSHGGSVDGVSSQEGTKENLLCSNRGICDYDLGICKCFNGYGSSNGNMESGQRGDCGWRIPYAKPNELF